MASYVQARINSIIFVTGIAIFCLGVLLFGSSYKVENELKDNEIDSEFGKNHCEYWAAIPAILTGIILIVSAYERLKQYHEWLIYVRTCCILILMVLVLGVMLEEATDSAWSHALVDGSYCNYNYKFSEPHDDSRHKERCDALRRADKWFYVMLFTADVLLVLTIVALFAIFAQWMLLASLKTSQNTENSLQMSDRYIRFSSEAAGDSQPWQGETGDQVPLHPV